MTIARPAAWDKLRAATTQNQIEQIVSSLTTDKQADVLIFALTTKAENDLTKKVLDRIVDDGALSSLTKDQQSALLNRATSNALNPASVSYFLDKSNAPLVLSLSRIHDFLAA